MTDLGPVQCFLGIDIEPDRQNCILHIHKQRAVHQFLAEYGLSDRNGHWISQTTGSRLRKLDPTNNPDPTAALNADQQRRYQSMVGSLMWLMLATRPDLASTVSTRLRYLRNTSDLAI
ncbi:hypothetical protein BZA05DRAFT_407800 [Tricharina praecox]|uniref:uncharacterized protein n=1 Tax=Tricharina praecox TaxID=43433 RepID=UPI00221E6723|nr:uncharacterized protein BZA05DRAFT_407800 [Tricharina praecox]KAI5845476.1 hypothetical protein BZA05DRAFT_407800 [Tricharina praecox]